MALAVGMPAFHEGKQSPLWCVSHILGRLPLALEGGWFMVVSPVGPVCPHFPSVLSSQLCCAGLAGSAGLTY